MPRLTVFSKEAVSTDQMLATFNRQFLKISRYTDKEIEALGDLSQLSNEQLQDLIARSMALQSKVRRLDTTIHAPAIERAAIGNPLVPQLNRLKAAFEH